MRRAACIAGAVVALALGAAPASAAVQMTSIGTFTSPTFVTAPPGDTSRLFVVERQGTIQVVSGGVRKEFLNIGSDVATDGERGLLSMAFAPDYATNGLFYVFYTANAPLGNIRVEELRRSAVDPDKADPASRRIVLDQTHDANNHNGGQLQFGPDGYLYVSIGDNATSSNAQTLSNVFGKVLRIDPHTNAGPSDNPFAGVAGADGRIFALGLRNPWRFSFDRSSGQLVIGDVGQSSWEEVDIGAKGTNYGWPSCEGFCANPSFVNPVLAYDHSGGRCAITGGYVVRADDLPSLAGRYVYADYCAGPVRSAALATPVTDDRAEGFSVAKPVSFGEDACGHLYAVAEAGTVWRLSETSPAPACSPPAAQAPPEPAPQPTPVAKDTRAPKLSVASRRRQRVGRRRQVRLRASCDERCRVKAQATLVLGRKRMRIRGKTLAVDKASTIVLPTTRRVQAAIADALRAHRAVRVDLRVVAADDAGNAAPVVRRRVVVVS